MLWRATLFGFVLTTTARVAASTKTSSYARPASEPEISLDSAYGGLLCEGQRCSEQVHLQLGGADEMVVSFVAANSETLSEVYYGLEGSEMDLTAKGHAETYSALRNLWSYVVHPPMGKPATTVEHLNKLQDTSSWAFDPETGEHYANYYKPPTPTDVKMGLGSYKNPFEYYNSPFIHTVTLERLKPGARYNYRVAGDDRVLNFTMPLRRGDSDHVTIGIMADVGQTKISQANHLAVLNMRPDLAVIVGDLSYADGYIERWDSYARMAEPLSSHVPVMSVGGNHEVGSSEAWQSYNVRYPMPWRASGSSSNLFWSRAVGPVHLIGLNSYAATANSSAQFTWLLKDLAAVNRTATPWLVVMMHVPWYNSNTGHWGEAALMQADMEELLYTAGVDLVLAGHVHAYERTHPVYKGKPDECGPTYITIGDGGNREGAYVPWREPQPMWSAFREAAFGVGKLDVVNATHAEFLWTRHACEGSDDPYHMNFNKTCSTIDDNSIAASVPSDSVTLRSHGARCHSPSSSSSSSASISIWWIILSVAAGIVILLPALVMIRRWLGNHRAPQAQDYVEVDIE